MKQIIKSTVSVLFSLSHLGHIKYANAKFAKPYSKIIHLLSFFAIVICHPWLIRGPVYYQFTNIGTYREMCGAVRLDEALSASVQAINQSR